MLKDTPQKIRVKPVSNHRLTYREAYPLDHWVLTPSAHHIPVCYVESTVRSPRLGKLNWEKVSNDSIHCYQRRLRSSLAELNVPTDAINCVDPHFTDYLEVINRYCQDITDCLVHAGQKSIPKCKPSCKRIPGWNDHVRPLRDDSIFWHRIW